MKCNDRIIMMKINDNVAGARRLCTDEGKGVYIEGKRRERR